MSSPSDPAELARQLRSRARAVARAASVEASPQYQAILVNESNLLDEAARCILKQAAIIEAAANRAKAN